MMGWGGSFGKSGKAANAGGTEMEKGKGKKAANDDRPVPPPPAGAPPSMSGKSISGDSGEQEDKECTVCGALNCTIKFHCSKCFGEKSSKKGACNNPACAVAASGEGSASRSAASRSAASRSAASRSAAGKREQKQTAHYRPPVPIKKEASKDTRPRKAVSGRKTTSAVHVVSAVPTAAEHFNTIQMSFDMKEKGILSEEEFENIKTAMLDKISKL